MSTLPLGFGVTLIGHAQGYWALNKPAGLRAHPNTEAPDPKALLNAPYDAHKEAYVLGNNQFFFLLHRLDSPTSGVMLGCFSAEKAQQGRLWLEQQALKKIYLGWVFGHPQKAQGVWNFSLNKQHKGDHVHVSVGGPLWAQTAFKVLESRRYQGLTMTLLQLEPLTGRTHQLRVHCAQNDCPIVGDKTYGHPKHNRSYAKASGLDRLMLHAWGVTLPGGVSFNVPPPEGWWF